MTPGSDDQSPSPAPDAAAQAAPQPQPDTDPVSVIYRANEGDPVSTVWRGRTFIKDQPLMLDPRDEAEFGIIEAARGNPSFDVGGENKAEQRAEDARERERYAAKVELAGIDAAGEALEQQQTKEMAEIEQRHQSERDAFLNNNEKRAIALRRVIRGSDGSDDLQHADDPPKGSENQPAADQSPAPLNPPTPTGGAGGQVAPAQAGEQPTDPSEVTAADPARQPDNASAQGAQAGGAVEE